MAEPSKWYHWALLYPGLILSLGGSVPTVWNEIKAWRLGVQSQQVQQVQEQQRLWEKNLPCLRLKPVYAVTLADGVEVGVTLCESGDALLKYQRAKDVVSFTWIRYPEHGRASESQHSDAGDVLTPQTTVVVGGTRCVVLQGTVVLWVLYDDDTQAHCHVDYVTTVRGVLLRAQAVPCQTCEG